MILFTPPSFMGHILSGLIHRLRNLGNRSDELIFVFHKLIVSTCTWKISAFRNTKLVNRPSKLIQSVA